MPSNQHFSTLFLPVYLALLDDHFVGFLSHDATMKPYLCPVDHWETHTRTHNKSVVSGVSSFFTLVNLPGVKWEYLCSERMGAGGWDCPGHSYAGSVSMWRKKRTHFQHLPQDKISTTSPSVDPQHSLAHWTLLKHQFKPNHFISRGFFLSSANRSRPQRAWAAASCLRQSCDLSSR